MKALVTGGGGFLGGRIVEMLLDRGDSVRVFGRHEYPRLARRGVECVCGDIRDEAALLPACDGVDTVFHAAAVAGIGGDRRHYFETNVRGTANVIRGCLEANVGVLVYTGSPSVVIGDADIENGTEALPYADRYLAPYPESKARAEKLVLDANGWEMVPKEITPIPGSPAEARGLVRRLRTCSLRPHLLWGPGDPYILPRIVRAARCGRFAFVGNGGNRVTVTYVDNAAHAHLLAADELAGRGACAGKAYFVGDAEPVVLRDWVNRVLKTVGAPPVRRSVPYGIARIVGALCEAAYRIFPLSGDPPLTRFAVEQMARSHWFSNAGAERDLGYEPIVSAPEGLERFARWFAEQQSGEGRA